jgi:hypothetical protein
MWIFSIMAVLMLIGTAICYFVMGYLPDMYIQVSAYGFILAGIGYIIELLKKREKNVDEHIEWIFEKKFKLFFEEQKTIRTMILKLEERREMPDFTPSPNPTPTPQFNPMNHLKNGDKQLYAQTPPIVFPKMKQDE